jgi:nucleoid-associated protein YgaU
MDVMKAGDSLARGESLKSPNGRFELKMQPDGNIVLYDGTTPTWATNTQKDDAERLEMQDDGNLVAYQGKKNAVWSTRTSGKKGASLKLQDDGNLVVYPQSSADKPLWSSGTFTETAATPAPAPTAAATVPVAAVPTPNATTAAAKAANVPMPPVVKPASSTNVGATQAKPVAATKAANKRTYTVAKGDSLWRIAEKIYGNGSDFKKIARANSISDPDHIRPGQELVIPE